MDTKLLNVGAVCGRLDIGKTKFYALAKEGRLELLKIGRRTLITAESVERFIDHARAHSPFRPR